MDLRRRSDKKSNTAMPNQSPANARITIKVASTACAELKLEADNMTEEKSEETNWAMEVTCSTVSSTVVPAEDDSSLRPWVICDVEEEFTA